MPRSATDRTAASTAKKVSLETLFTVRTLLPAAFEKLSTFRAQRGRSCERGAVGGVVSHLFLHRFAPGKNLS